MLDFAQKLRGRGCGLRVLSLGGGDVDTSTPMDSMLVAIMAALAQMEHDIKRERIIDSIAKRREAGKSLGGGPRLISDSRIRNDLGLVDRGEPAAQVARNLGMSRATFYRRSWELTEVGHATCRPAIHIALGPTLVFSID